MEQRVAFYTLGCKVNQQETDGLRALFLSHGYREVPFEESADVYVVNTCTVTAISDKKSRQAIARAHAKNPAAKIAVVGCYAQQSPETVASLPGVRLVLGTQRRAEIVDLIEDADPPVSAVKSITGKQAFETLPEAPRENASRTRAQLKIQDGCENFCAYCIIPYVRGPICSRPKADIQAALTALGARQTAEVVLTGIHLMSYGREDASLPTLADIITLAATTEGIGRVRLGSLDPSLVDEQFVTALAALPQGRLCRQFHLSLQSGSESVLRRMNRRYTPAQYAYAAALLRSAFPGCALTTDIIAGFPGETDAEHAESLAFAERMQFARIHVFPYSRREGTAAAAMTGQIIKQVRDARAKELIALGEQMEHAYVAVQIGSVQQFLPETDAGKGYMEGYTDTYVRMRVRCDALPGTLLQVRVAGVEGALAVGEDVSGELRVES